MTIRERERAGVGETLYRGDMKGHRSLTVAARPGTLGYN
jgi:hypothetical protein